VRATLRRILFALVGSDSAASLDTSTGKLPSPRRRRRRARSVKQLVEDARQSCAAQFAHPAWERSIRLRTDVVRACQAELLAIQGALLDHRQPISAQALQQLRRFLLDPGTSPLFGSNPARARRAALHLQWSFTGRPEP
jgi:hypothetical protein